MIHSLYLHVPFCIRKCIYCDFLSVPYDSELAAEYTTAVVRELEMRKEKAGGLRTIYIGGGTPTTLAMERFEVIFGALRSWYTIAPGAEITVEANPGTVDRHIAAGLAALGVNRFSVGIQSFKDDELRLLGRIHSAGEGIEAIKSVQDSTAGNISIDLIYGIPGQTLEGWTASLECAVGLSPSHISCYELTPEPGTPLFELIRKGVARKPDEDTIVSMYYNAIDRLSDSGYRHYEISNFSRPGFECRHNLNYWDRGEYLGIGAGSHSFIVDRRIRNTGDVRKYIAATGSGALPEEESVEVSCEEAFREFIFLGLRKTAGLNIREFREDLGIDLPKISGRLIDEGLLHAESGCLRLTRRGLVVSNTVMAELLRALEGDPAP